MEREPFYPDIGKKDGFVHSTLETESGWPLLPLSTSATSKTDYTEGDFVIFGVFFHRLAHVSSLWILGEDTKVFKSILSVMGTYYWNVILLSAGQIPLMISK